MPAIAVVLDTNVLVAAGFKPASAAGRIVAAIEHGRVRMVWNEATRRESERILRRIPPLRGRAIERLFLVGDRFDGETDVTSFAGIPDPDDRKFAALAGAARATLVSNDAHLLNHSGGCSIRVLTSGAFWREIGGPGESWQSG